MSSVPLWGLGPVITKSSVCGNEKHKVDQWIVRSESQRGTASASTPKSVYYSNQSHESM